MYMGGGPGGHGPGLPALTVSSLQPAMVQQVTTTCTSGVARGQYMRKKTGRLGVSACGARGCITPALSSQLSALHSRSVPLCAW